MAASLFWGWTPVEVPDGHIFVLEASKQMSLGVSYCDKSEYRFLIGLSFEETSPRDVLLQYTPKFGPLIAGTQIFFRMRNVDVETGQVSPWVYGSSIVS